MYRVRLLAQLDEGGYLDEKEVTPDSAPQVQVLEGVPAEVRFEVGAKAGCGSA